MSAEFPSDAEAHRLATASSSGIDSLLLAVCERLKVDDPAARAAIDDGVSMYGLRPVRALMNTGILSDDHASLLLPDTEEDQLGPQPLRWEEVDLEVTALLDPSTLRRLHVLPFRDNRGTVVVAAPQARLQAKDRRELLLEIGDFEVYHVDEQSLTTCLEMWETNIAKINLARETGRSAAVVGGAKSIGKKNYERLVERVVDDPDANESGLLLRELFLQASQSGASDIHIAGEELANNEPGYVARLRTDGDVHPLAGETGDPQVITRAVGDALVNRFVTVAKLDPETKRPRSGRFEIEIPGGGRYDLRVEVTPLEGFGHLVVARMLGGTERLLTMDEIYPPDESSLAEDSRRVISNMRAGGLFLIAGATGSGKSTYLAAVMHELNDPRDHLITIENPIEYRLKGIHQIQATRGILEFDDAIESSLRLDPNIIMIGELRSPETVKIAIQAAQTGHMVLSTIHVRDAASTPSRFKHLGVSPADVAEVLKGVLAQNLLRTHCIHCVQAQMPRENCRHCSGSGWGGRAAVAELLTVDDELSSMIIEGHPPQALANASKLRTKALHAGMLLAKGRTSQEEVFRQLGLDASEEAMQEAERIHSESKDSPA